MAKKILGVVGAIIIVFLGYVAFQPSHYRISREIIVNSAPDKIFPYVNNSQKMNEWMPWKEQDSQMVMSYSGPEEGVGAVSSWESPGQMGHGKAEIVESVSNQTVKTKLTYTKPMEMSQMADVSLQVFGETTRVIWSVEGDNTFMGRLFCIFINMDKMVGGEFEKGLANLKTMVEAVK